MPTQMSSRFLERDLPDGPNFSLRRLADYYGIDYYTWWRWTREGRLRSLKIGGVVRIPREALREFIYGKDETGARECNDTKRDANA
jgi:excisionase family DNA binding protein